jgi:hypothetical protein
MKKEGNALFFALCRPRQFIASKARIQHILNNQTKSSWQACRFGLYSISAQERFAPLALRAMLD